MGKAGGWGLTRMAYSGDALRSTPLPPTGEYIFGEAGTMCVKLRWEMPFSKIFDKYIIYRPFILFVAIDGSLAQTNYRTITITKNVAYHITVLYIV